MSIKSVYVGYIQKMIKFLFKKLHIHHWIPKAQNRYYMETASKCRCGMTREITHTPPDAGGMPKFEFWWSYSDGTREPDERIFKHLKKS